MLQSIRRGCHLTTLATEELDKQARDWAAILYGVIPEDQLKECQRLAEINPDRNVNDHNFPIRRRELIDAWYRLQASEGVVHTRECEYCRMHKSSPEQYQSCPFHTKAIHGDFPIE